MTQIPLSLSEKENISLILIFGLWFSILVTQILPFLSKIEKFQSHIFGWFVIFSFSDPNPTFFVTNKKLNISPIFFVGLWFLIPMTQILFLLLFEERQISVPFSFLILVILNPCVPYPTFLVNNREITVLVLPLQAPPWRCLCDHVLEILTTQKLYQIIDNRIPEHGYKNLVCNLCI